MKKRLLIIVSCLLVTLTAWALIPANLVVGDSRHVQSLVASASPCKLYAVTGYNSGPAQYLLIFQAGYTPTNLEVAKFSFPIAAASYFSVDLSYYGADLDAASICNSTTDSTNTLGSVNCSFQAILARP